MSEPTRRPPRLCILLFVARPLLPLLPLAACALAGLALAACGDAGESIVATDGDRASVKAAPPPPRLPDGAPAALRRNVADANRLSGSGTADLRARLAKLRGHPVVVNQWASWCGPCREEFPFFAKAVERYGDRVAFVGIDLLDSRAAAREFLADRPPGFASIFDPDGAATRSLGGGRGAPTTFFIGADGRTVHTKIGGYPDAEALHADIRRYALERS